MNYPNSSGTELLGKPITNIRMSDDGLISFDFMGGNMPPEPEVYQLIYMIGDSVYMTYELEFGTVITPEPYPEGDYIRFEWIGVPETMPDHDVTITADFETGIIDITTLQGIKAIYAPNGKRLIKLQKGLNIIRTSDGRVRKIFISSESFSRL